MDVGDSTLKRVLEAAERREEKLRDHPVNDLRDGSGQCDEDRLLDCQRLHTRERPAAQQQLRFTRGRRASAEHSNRGKDGEDGEHSPPRGGEAEGG
eukprot:CAMPEP_0180037098 /NCGR_PEP_ID=MMETSP0984-20121128/31350_1 /TAXON_ID=483367 /ORGANISM="non described non described, Strain CCMP 2436" /LENGTH=95 /DNA_ID=CAMNT_0021963459 /DNA_START=23 /DNA_END=307 /DNA_ORIENTATION=+